ncbi:MCE family protein [Mycobacterium aquaticum]|uniref:Mammalian cell entry protein n=1 Tax=Mycobacterium aquaticum TaxID=1927124 RepID=A0A1X0AWQ5_9MYCO|nr:MCE family protein [Mycobacterium aquaticum]ORA34492.1 mammalian cell entry protein [Mycobacterium aquaticum]
MTTKPVLRHAAIAALCVALTSTSCAYGGLNSLPLPGTVGRGPGSTSYHVELANVGTLEPNSPVLFSDVVVGSITSMAVKNWHANVEISVKPGVVIPADAIATVGQTSLLGSMHLQLGTPPDKPGQGALMPGATIGLDRSSTYPSTEQTLSSLSAVVNGGALGRFGDIIRNANDAFHGRTADIRDLLSRLNAIAGVVDDQRQSITALIESFNRLAATFADQRQTLSRTLQTIPPALDVLNRERPRITNALERLGEFSNAANQVINRTQEDLVSNLRNLGPTLQSLADVGPQLDTALAMATTFPYDQSFIDRAVRGDYMNLFPTFDLTVPRLKRDLFLGTRWGDEGAQLVPAPGDPWYLNYTYDPLGVGAATSPPASQPGAGPDPSQIFAGPYGPAVDAKPDPHAGTEGGS